MKLNKVFIVIFGILISSVAKADTTGAIIGSLIGSQFGGGNGRVAAAAIGAVIGDRASNKDSSQYNGNNYYSPTTQQMYVVQQVPVYQPQPQVVYIYQSVPVYIETRHHHYR